MDIGLSNIKVMFDFKKFSVIVVLNYDWSEFKRKWEKRY